MARIDLYLGDDEKEFVRDKHPGWVRSLIRREMAEIEPVKSERRSRAAICPRCGIGLSFPGQSHKCVPS